MGLFCVTDVIPVLCNATDSSRIQSCNVTQVSTGVVLHNFHLFYVCNSSLNTEET